MMKQSLKFRSASYVLFNSSLMSHRFPGLGVDSFIREVPSMPSALSLGWNTVPGYLLTIRDCVLSGRLLGTQQNGVM